MFTTLCDKVCQWLAIGRRFSPDPPVSSTNKTDIHDVTEILLKVTLNTIKQNKQQIISWLAVARHESNLICYSLRTAYHSYIDSSTNQNFTYTDSSTNQNFTYTDSLTNQNFTYIDSSTNQNFTDIDSSTNQNFTYIDSSTKYNFTYIDSSTNYNFTYTDSLTNQNCTYTDSSTN